MTKADRKHAATKSKARQPVKAATLPALFSRFEWLAPVVLSVVLAALVFSWANSLFTSPPILRDALGYTMTAQRLVSQHVFAFSVDSPNAGRLPPNAAVTPGYVVFLAGIYAISPARSADATASAIAVQPTVQGLQFVLALVTVALIAVCGFRLGGKRLAYLAGVLSAVYLPIGWGSRVALSETLAAALVALQLLLALLVVREQPPASIARMAWFGAVSAVLALVRPITAAWIAIPLLYLAARRFFGWKQLARMAAAAAIAYVAIMGIWWVRNEVTLHRLVVLSEGAGNPLLLSTGGYPLTPEEQTLADAAEKAGRDPELVVAEQRIRTQLSTDPLGLLGSRALTAYQVVQTPWIVPQDAFWESINDASAAKVESAPLVAPDLNTLMAVASATNYYQVFLLVMACVGLAFGFRRPRVWLVASVPLYFVVAQSTTLFINRYFFPAMPAVIVLAAAGALGLVSAAFSLGRRFTGRAAA